MAIDSAAKYAYVANYASNNISVFGIGSKGTLKFVPGSPFAAGQYPCSMAMDWSKALSVPQIFVVETEPRHEQTARLP